jgi:hypothetical protein
MEERQIDPEFLKKLSKKWSVDGRGTQNLQRSEKIFWKKLEKKITQETKQEKLPLLERVRSFIINKLLPDGYIVVHKYRALGAALEEERNSQREYMEQLEEDLKSAWNNLAEAKREEEQMDELKRKRRASRERTSTLVLPVEETENSEQD